MKNIEKKKIIWGILLMLVLVAGVSYAAWILDFQQTKKNTVATSCFDITLTSDTEGLDLQKAYPLLDSEGEKLIPYTFTIKNNCEAYASYQVNLEVLNTSTLTDAGFIKVMFDTEIPELLSSNEIVNPTLTDATTSYKLFTGYLNKEESISHNVRIWLDENVDMEDALNNLTFKSKVTVTASYIKYLPSSYEACVANYGADSVQCGIIAQVDTSALCPEIVEGDIIYDIELEETNSLLCSAPDDYGTSYYFRGVPENNWVEFANSYWRIIRINGNDSIRMIYAGNKSTIDALDETTKATVMSNGYSDASTGYTQIGTSMYNEYWKKDNILESVTTEITDNAGVGFMYGNRDGIVEASIATGSYQFYNDATYYIAESYDYDPTTDRFSLNQSIALSGSEITTDYEGYYTFYSDLSDKTSPILYKIVEVAEGTDEKNVGLAYITYGTTSKEKAQTNTNDSTIKDVIDSWYEANLANYASYISDTLFCNDRSLTGIEATGYTNLSYGVESTAYRWKTYQNGMKFTCKEQNDRFTVDDEVVGNGDLTYPIGLITTDEIWVAGSAYTNTSFYLYNGGYYWTMTPAFYNYGLANVRVMMRGEVYAYNGVTASYGVRPVINLKSNSLKSGDGSSSNPYKVE